MATTPTGVVRASGPPAEETYHRRVPGHEVSFKMCGVDPPSILYVQMDDMLRVTLAGYSTITAFLEVRILRADGTITVEEEQITAPNSTTPASRQFRLPEGYILSASLAVQPPGVARGTLYGQLALVRSQAPAPIYLYPLAFGFLGLLTPLTWPATAIVSPPTTGGEISWDFTGPPAAGADWSYSITAGLRQRIQSINASLTTSAAVANRIVVAYVTESTHTIFQAASPSAQTASTTVAYSLCPGLPAQVLTAGTVIIPLPAGLIQGTNTRIGVTTQALQAADQWGTEVVGVELFLDS